MKKSIRQKKAPAKGRVREKFILSVKGKKREEKQTKKNKSIDSPSDPQLALARIRFFAKHYRA